MKYRGVAHMFAGNPEFDALRKFGKSFAALNEADQATITASVGDLAINDVFRDTPDEAMTDALNLCILLGLEPSYAMIKREDNHYFTTIALAEEAASAN